MNLEEARNIIARHSHNLKCTNGICGLGICDRRDSPSSPPDLKIVVAIDNESYREKVENMIQDMYPDNKAEGYPIVVETDMVHVLSGN